MFHLQLCSAHYIVLQTKNSVRNFSEINPVTMENVGEEESHIVLSPCIVNKKTRTQSATKHVLGRSDVKQ